MSSTVLLYSQLVVLQCFSRFLRRAASKPENLSTAVSYQMLLASIALCSTVHTVSILLADIRFPLVHSEGAQQSLLVYM